MVYPSAARHLTFGLNAFTTALFSGGLRSHLTGFQQLLIERGIWSEVTNRPGTAFLHVFAKSSRIGAWNGVSEAEAVPRRESAGHDDVLDFLIRRLRRCRCDAATSVVIGHWRFRTPPFLPWRVGVTEPSGHGAHGPQKPGLRKLYHYQK